jgi:hypothetical protein
MGQYYIAFILAPKSLTQRDEIHHWVHPNSFNSGDKLMEHSYFGEPFVESFECLLSPEGSAYMSRVVWAGDYADKEPLVDGEDEADARNLHEMRRWNQKLAPPMCSSTKYRYIVNHDKQQYVDKQKKYFDEDGNEVDNRIHPLPLLTVEGNGRGGGDYYYTENQDKVGIWARDVISVEIEAPADYTELEVNFN